MPSTLRVLATLSFLVFYVTGVNASCIPSDPHRFSERISAITEKNDHGEVVLLGSSTIEGLGSLRVNPFEASEINAGIWGAEIVDIDVHLSNILPRSTRFVVLYAGENDITGGCTPSAVVNRLDTLLQHIHAQSPGAQVLFVGQKPSIARAHLWPQIDAFNVLAEVIIRMKYRDFVHFVDLPKALWGTRDTLDPLLYADDGLHFSPSGQNVFLTVVREALRMAKDEN